MSKWLQAWGLPVALALAGCGTTIRPGQMGIKYIALDEPALKQTVLPEGFYWQWPWNDIVRYDVTWQSKDEQVEVLTADDLHVPTTVTVTYRPTAKLLHQLHTTIGPHYYEDVIRPLFITLVRSQFAKHEHNSLARESPDIEQAVQVGLVKRLGAMPLEIGRVAIKHVRYEQRLTSAISAKLTQEQLVEQKKFELQVAARNADIARTQAKGIADAIRIRAEGESQAVVLKGKAQAEAQGAITKTLSKRYLQYKAFDGTATRYYFVPTGKDGLPIIVEAGAGRRPVYGR